MFQDSWFCQFRIQGSGLGFGSFMRQGACLFCIHVAADENIDATQDLKGLQGSTPEDSFRVFWYSVSGLFMIFRVSGDCRSFSESPRGVLT